MVSLVERFALGWWDVAAVLVQASVFEPVDVLGGGVFDGVRGAPGALGFDQLGLVQALIVSARALS